MPMHAGTGVGTCMCVYTCVPACAGVHRDMGLFMYVCHMCIPMHVWTRLCMYPSVHMRASTTSICMPACVLWRRVYVHVCVHASVHWGRECVYVQVWLGVCMCPCMCLCVHACVSEHGVHMVVCALCTVVCKCSCTYLCPYVPLGVCVLVSNTVCM